MKRFVLVVAVIFIAAVLAACGSEEVQSVEFTLSAVGGSGVSGTATFEKVSDTQTKITVELSGTTAGNSHPMHIHEGDIDPGGGIFITLTPVSGDTGKSVTTVTQSDGSNAVSYEDLLDYDGYINVHESTDNLGVILANGEVGAGAQ